MPPADPINQVCGPKSLHDVGVAGNASRIKFGSSAFCPGNTVGGNATFDINKNPIGVFLNSIGGTLSCLGNASVIGAGNTAKHKLGQCAAF